MTIEMTSLRDGTNGLAQQGVDVDGAVVGPVTEPWLFLPALLAQAAQVSWLTQAGLLTKQDLAAVQTALIGLGAEVTSGTLRIESHDDIHVTVERALQAALAAPQVSPPAVLSRHDQAMTAIRLAAKQRGSAVQLAVLSCCTALLSLTGSHEATASAVGASRPHAEWAAIYTEALLDDLAPLRTALSLNEQSALDASTPESAHYLSQLLGFLPLPASPGYAREAAGKSAALVVQALAQVMLDLSKLAHELQQTKAIDASNGAVPGIAPDDLAALESLPAAASTMLTYQQRMMELLLTPDVDHQAVMQLSLDALTLALESATTMARLLSAPKSAASNGSLASNGRAAVPEAKPGSDLWLETTTARVAAARAAAEAKQQAFNALAERLLGEARQTRI